MLVAEREAHELAEKLGLGVLDVGGQPGRYRIITPRGREGIAEVARPWFANGVDVPDVITLDDVRALLHAMSKPLTDDEEAALGLAGVTAVLKSRAAKLGLP